MTGLPDYRITGLPDYRITGLPDYRITQPAPALSNPDRLTSPPVIPPTRSPAGFALVSRTPPQGGSNAVQIIPPLRGNPIRKRIGWGDNNPSTYDPPALPADAGIHPTRRGLFSALLCLPLLFILVAPVAAQTAHSLTLNPTTIQAGSLDGAKITLTPVNVSFFGASGIGGGGSGGLSNVDPRTYVNSADLVSGGADGRGKIPNSAVRLSALGLEKITLSGAPAGLTIASGQLLARQLSVHGVFAHRSVEITLAYSGSGISADDTVTVTVDGDALRRVDEGENRQNLSNISATITIKQTSQPAITIAADANAVTEGTGAGAQFTLTAFPTPSSNLTVNLAVSETGDFVASSDKGTQMVTIGTSGTATHTVPIVNDSTAESSGSVTVTIKSGSSYRLGSTTSATVTVSDDDTPNNAPTVANMIPNQSATVGTAFTYAFPTNTFNDADSDSLTYSALKSDDTALPSWLTFTTGTRTFSGTPQSGDVGTLSVKVTAIDGNSGSISDTFNIVVSAAAPIIPTVDFSSSSSSVLEDAGTHNVTINLSSAAPSGGLTLAYTVGGNATAGSGNDFTIQNQGTLNVIAGATTATIPVVIIDDSNPITEPVETVILTLIDGTGYTLGSTTIVHTLTITDNDTTTHPGTTTPTTNPGNNNNNNNTPPTAPVIPPVSVSAQALTLTEGAMESYTLVLDSAPTTSVTIEITPQDSTRITVTPATVVFTPDNWQSPQSVSVQAQANENATEQTVQLIHRIKGSNQRIASVMLTIQPDTTQATTPWLSRMGRTVAEQAIDGIRKRMDASRTPGLSATLAGWSVPMNPSSGEFDPDSYILNPASQNPATATGQTLNAQDILSNSQFLHTTGLDLRGGNAAFWGQLSETDFEGTQHNIHTQGESRTLQIGADYSVNDWMTGFSLLSSTTEGMSQRQAIQERMESNLTALIPYSAKTIGDTRIWGAFGIGQGQVSRYRGNIKRNESDLDWQMLNIGANSEIKTTETVNLSLNTDALWVRTQSDESKQDHINPSISRIRAGLQSTWNHTLYNTELQPTFTIGARHDGGGAESGFGLYAGSGLRWTSPTVQIDIEGQYLLSHQQEIEEKGFSASLIHDRTPHSDLGFSLSLSQRPSLDIDGLNSWWMAESVLTPSSSDNRWVIDAAYGLPAFDGRFTGIPHIGMGLDGDTTDIQLGWRMTPLATHRNLSLGIQATRFTQEQTAPKHWFGVEARVRW